MILGLILLFLIMIIGGDRGVISLIALVGNMLLLSLAIWLMAAGAPVLLVTIGMGIIISCVTLFYQNGTNEKTKSAFAAVLITMTVLFFFIFMFYFQLIFIDVFFFIVNLKKWLCPESTFTDAVLHGQ